MEVGCNIADMQMRVWKGTSKWVVLWLLLSVLTLLHSAALIAAMYDVPAAKACTCSDS